MSTGKQVTIISIMFIVWLFGIYAVDKYYDDQWNLVKSIAEMAERKACQNAGLNNPIWQPCAHSQKCFFCADNKGILVQVQSPKCNTNMFGSPSRYKRLCGVAEE